MTYGSISGCMAPAAASNPALTNIFTWYDFAHSSNLNLTATAINAALDRSGNGRDTPTQTGSTRPTFTAAQQNGLPTAVYTSSQNLQVPAAMFNLPKAAFDIYAVAKRNIDSTTQIIFNLGGATGSTECAIYYDTPGLVAGVCVPSNATRATLSGITTTNYNIFKLSFNGTNLVSLQCNRGTAATAAGAVCNDINAGQLSGRVGGLSLAGGEGELITYNANLGTTDSNNTWTYLSNKWGIPIS